MFRLRPMGPAATLPATSGSGTRPVQISSPRSIALEGAAGQAEALHPQTVSSFCCSSGSGATADGHTKSRRRRIRRDFVAFVPFCVPQDSLRGPATDSDAMWWRGGEEVGRELALGPR